MVESLVVTYGLGGADQIKTLMAAGAVGDVIGHFIDANGEHRRPPLNRRTIAIGLEDLRGIRKVVLRRRRPQEDRHHAAPPLRGRYVTVLVTDDTPQREKHSLVGLPHSSSQASPSGGSARASALTMSPRPRNGRGLG